MNITLQQSRDFSMYSEEAWIEWYTLAYTKGGALSEFSVRGSMGSRMFLKERDYLGFPFALDVKGGA